MALAIRLPQANETSFSNTTNGFTATNVQAAVEEAKVANTLGFSYALAGLTFTIPSDQQMMVYQHFEITDLNEVNIEGELVVIN